MPPTRHQLKDYMRKQTLLFQVFLDTNLEKLILDESDLVKSDLQELLRPEDGDDDDVTSVARSTLVGFPSRPLWLELDTQLRQWISNRSVATS